MNYWLLWKMKFEGLIPFGLLLGSLLLIVTNRVMDPTSQNVVGHLLQSQKSILFIPVSKFVDECVSSIDHAHKRSIFVLASNTGILPL